MRFRKSIYSLCAVGVFVIGICGIVAYYMMQYQDVAVAFLDVGQGDATLISHGSYQILIDGGSDQTVLLEEIGHVMPFWDRKIEIVIATHPDADHIDGLIGVFTYYDVDQFWHTSAQKDSSILDKLVAVSREGGSVEDVQPIAGDMIFISDHAYMEIIYPYSKVPSAQSDINDTSVASVVNIGQQRFYLGGDLSSQIEDEINFAEPLAVVKASHHGAKTSTSDVFLQKTQVRDVIISVGVDNRYGHPHDEVIKRIEKQGLQVLRTDQRGRIIYHCSDNKCDVFLER